MPAILIQLFVCSWKGHIWGKVEHFGQCEPFQLCERCAAMRRAIKANPATSREKEK
ncbi:MAG: hypothetical protein WA821_18535 [Anaerolineales bacterium]